MDSHKDATGIYAMTAPKIAVVFVHGLFSSVQTWDRFAQLIEADPVLKNVDMLRFSYPSPKFHLNPMRRIPNFNVLADSLQTYLEVDAASYANLILVGHSQGGLIIQRYLSRMVGAGRARELNKIRLVILFACPNSGSEIFLIFRHIMRFWKHPQEAELRPINEAVTEAQQAVLNHIVYAQKVTSDQFPIPIIAYAGDSDNIVTPTSARSVFPNTGVIPGDHFTIIQPNSPTNRSYTTLRFNLLEAIKVSEKPTVDRHDPDAGEVNAGSSIKDGESIPKPGGEYVIARLNPSLQTLDFILSPETALAWARKLSEKEQADE
jgi:triacylglycerol esterase/lipase EstA (alpha/beta hydrolase family)